MEYLLVQHCRGWKLGRSTKSPSSPSDECRHEGGETFVLTVWDHRTTPSICSHVDCRIRLGSLTSASPPISRILLLWTFFSSFCQDGGNSRHPFAFSHTSWYYHPFIQPLFKLDADRVAPGTCVSKKGKNWSFNYIFICWSIPFFPFRSFRKTGKLQALVQQFLFRFSFF